MQHTGVLEKEDLQREALEELQRETNTIARWRTRGEWYDHFLIRPQTCTTDCSYAHDDFFVLGALEAGHDEHKQRHHETAPQGQDEDKITALEKKITALAQKVQHLEQQQQCLLSESQLKRSRTLVEGLNHATNWEDFVFLCWRFGISSGDGVGALLREGAGVVGFWDLGESTFTALASHLGNRIAAAAALRAGGSPRQRLVEERQQQGVVSALAAEPAVMRLGGGKSFVVRRSASAVLFGGDDSTSETFVQQSRAKAQLKDEQVSTTSHFESFRKSSSEVIDVDHERSKEVQATRSVMEVPEVVPLATTRARSSSSTTPEDIMASRPMNDEPPTRRNFRRSSSAIFGTNVPESRGRGPSPDESFKDDLPPQDFEPKTKKLHSRRTRRARRNSCAAKLGSVRGGRMGDEPRSSAAEEAGRDRHRHVHRLLLRHLLHRRHKHLKAPAPGLTFSSLKRILLAIVCVKMLTFVWDGNGR